MKQRPQITDEDLSRMMLGVKKPPGEWILAVIMSALIPGLGIMYFGDFKKGLKLFFITTPAYIIETVLYDYISASDNIFLPLIYSFALLAAIILWLYNVTETIRLYEVNLKLWSLKVGGYDKAGLNLSFLTKLDILHLSSLIAKLKERSDRSKKVEQNEQETDEERERREKESRLELMLNDPKRAIIYMSLIVSVTFIATKVNSFLDKMWISKISEEAVSAISTVSPIYSVVAAIGVGIGTGACVCISYTLGKKDYARSQQLANASLFLSVALSIPLALFLILSIDPIVSVQGPEITELATQYVIPLAIGCPAIILSGVLGSLFKAEGAMKIMTFCALLSVPVNAVLTPVFINMGWGMWGASTATALGSVVSMFASIHYFKKGKYHFELKFKKPDSSAIKEVLTVGGPKAIEEVLGGLIILAQTVLTAVVAGSTALAVIGVAFSFTYLMTMIPDSISAGAQPVCSAHAGAHNTSVMKSSIKYSFMLMLGLSLIPTFLLLFFTEPLLSIFGNGSSLMSEDMITAARIYAIITPFYLLQRMASNMLQVVRKSHISAPMYIGFGVLRLVLIALFATTVIGVVFIEAMINVLSAIGLGGALVYYTKKFDPEKVDENAEKRLDVLSTVKLSKKARAQ